MHNGAVGLGSLDAVFVSILIVQSTTFGVPIKIGLAYVFTEAIGLVVLGLWSAIFWIIRRTFLWVIDVVPAHGTNAEEAREVVLKGKAVPLAKKFATDIENWTDDNTQAFVSVMNWRARIFFDAKARIRRRVRKLKCFHEETYEDMTDEELNAAIMKYVGDFEDRKDDVPGEGSASTEH